MSTGLDDRQLLAGLEARPTARGPLPLRELREDPTGAVTPVVRADRHALTLVLGLPRHQPFLGGLFGEALLIGESPAEALATMGVDSLFALLPVRLPL